MTFLLPVGIVALLLTVPIVVMHMLAPRRPPTHVSSLLHWDGLRHSITSATPWQRLRLSLLLLLQILAMALLSVALARPAIMEEAALAEHTVFIVDASGSMAAIDGSPDRLGSAVANAMRKRNDLPDGGHASVVVASGRPTVLLAHNSDPAEFGRAVAGIRATHSAADWEATFALAESLVDPDRETGFVLISDGILTSQEQRLAPLGTQFVSVGETDVNRAITDLSVSVGPGVLTARVTVESTGGPTAVQRLHLVVDGELVRSELIEIPGGASVERLFELPLGTRVSAFLDGEDLLEADNQRYALAPALGVLKIRVHGENTYFVDQLLASLPDVETDVSPDEVVDVEIFVGVPVPAGTTTPFIAIDVPGGVPGVTPAGRVEFPVPTMIASDPILDEVDFSQIAIATAQALHLEGVTVLVSAPGAPLLIRGEVGQTPFFYLAFTLEQSNLPVNIAFPILGARMVGDLAASDDLPAGITVGDQIPLLPGHVAITDPGGTEIPLALGDSAPVASRTGFWAVRDSEGATTLMVVNPDLSQSHLAPSRELPDIRPAVAAPGEERPAGTVARTIVPWFILAILVVLAIELAVSHRERGVSQRQWNWGLAARGTIVVLLLLALIDPLIATRSRDVTTVFVVDVSASVGEARSLAVDWVHQALEHSEGSRWAVVDFGADARIAAGFESTRYGPARGIDPNATSISRGLRLGSSLLTGESRQRLVLISDGRPNSGDLQAEVDRLAALGIVVDVHTIGPEQLTDAAVARIDTPGRVSVGESYTATATITSTVSATATVSLSTASGMESRQVQLEPGDTQVTFDVVATEIGFQNLAVNVTLPGDVVRENDRAVAGVEVAGPASVLILEGEPDNGEVLQLALEASGLEVLRLPLAEAPDLAGLSVHQAVILVDAIIWELGDETAEALDSVVRDLGRGLVVLGGPRSYGAGAYHGSMLESMLPVDSEALDPTRRVDVAEVLLIDTSESMGACHCTNGIDVSRRGVVKTDIAKAGAVSAFQALIPTDEFGVIAFTQTPRWVLPLSEGYSLGTVEQEVGTLRPLGGTRIKPAIVEAAEALRNSDKDLKHMILFTDGFTNELLGGPIEGPTGPIEGGPDDIMNLVADLAEEGITISVVATGEGDMEQLERLAQAGRGRFYPGRDLDEIPEIFINESRLASRTYINEGEFLPTVTSSAQPVAGLEAAPPVLGYVAATPKPTADVLLRVGALGDPLLSSWSLGLGRVTAWTSDSGIRWAAPWAEWDGFTEFWSDVVRDTFPLAGAEGQRVRATITEGVMSITLEGAEAWPAGTSPQARIRRPDGSHSETRLTRVSDHEFMGTIPALEDGTYSVGVGFDRGDGEFAILSAVASRSFSAEFLPGPPDAALMAGISSATGGRGEIAPAQAFDPEGLVDGVVNRSLRWWFLFAAAMLWPVDVALRRLRPWRRRRRNQQSPRRRLLPTPTRP